MTEAQHDTVEDEEDDDGKIDKDDANYRLGSEHRHCELCHMFLHSERDGKGCDGECTLVEGRISPQGLCDYFERQKGRAIDGSFYLARDVIERLGAGDLRIGGKAVAELFGSRDGRTIHPDAVRRLGDGDIAAGHRVLRKFVAGLRRR
jgi:hypothetical protein